MEGPLAEGALAGAREEVGPEGAGAMAAGERAAVASASRLAGGGEGDSPRQRPSVPPAVPAVPPAAAPTAIAVPTPTPLGAPGAIGVPLAPTAPGALGAMGAMQAMGPMGFRLVLSPPAEHAAAPPRRGQARPRPRAGTAVEPRHAPLWQPWVLRDVILGEVDDCSIP